MVRKCGQKGAGVVGLRESRDMSGSDIPPRSLLRRKEKALETLSAVRKAQIARPKIDRCIIAKALQGISYSCDNGLQNPLVGT